MQNLMGGKKIQGCVYTEWFRLEGTWGSSLLQPPLRPRCLGFWPLKPRISKDEGPTTVLNAYSSVWPPSLQGIFFLRFNWDFTYYNTCVPSPPFTDHIWEKSCSMFSMTTHQVAENGTWIPLSHLQGKQTEPSEPLLTHRIFISANI